MVMIVKEHEKKAHGFISVTWITVRPCQRVAYRRLRAVSVLAVTPFPARAI
jgi:hypothetical protein